MRTWFKIPSLIAFLAALNLSTACVSTQSVARKEPDIIQRRVQTWLGKPRDFLEKHWGVSKHTKDMGMGLRYLTYRAKGPSKKKACSIVFTVDITNTIKGGGWSGERDSCLRFVKEVPQPNPRQQLVGI